MPEIPDSPMFDREGAIRGYRLNKMAMALSTPENRAAFLDDEAAFLDRFQLDVETREAVMNRDWQEMIRLGGNLFYILKLSAIDPIPLIHIGAAQAGMSPERFKRERLGEKQWHT